MLLLLKKNIQYFVVHICSFKNWTKNTKRQYVVPSRRLNLGKIKNDQIHDPPKWDQRSNWSKFCRSNSEFHVMFLGRPISARPKKPYNTVVAIQIAWISRRSAMGWIWLAWCFFFVFLCLKPVDLFVLKNHMHIFACRHLLDVEVYMWCDVDIGRNREDQGCKCNASCNFLGEKRSGDGIFFILRNSAHEKFLGIVHSNDSETQITHTIHVWYIYRHFPWTSTQYR